MKKLYSIMLKLDSILDKIQAVFCVTLFAAVVVFGTMQVCGRFVLNNSPTWTEELIRYCAIWLTFVGSAMTARHDGHVSVDILQEYVRNAKARAIIYTLARLLCVVFFVICIPAGLELAEKSVNSYGASVHVSFKYIYASIPIGALFIILAYLTRIPGHCKKIMEEGDRT